MESFRAFCAGEDTLNGVLMHELWITLGITLGILTLPGTIELLLLTLGGVLPARPRTQRSSSSGTNIAVVVPAHNEEASVERCVRALLQCEREESEFQVVVVADNCTDSTAALASAAGARVLVRNDPERRGKGWALDYGFSVLKNESFDAVLIVDADSVVQPNLITEVARLIRAGADAVQCRYLVWNATASPRTRLMNLALLAFNVLRPRGRQRWGISAGILGNGFALSRDTLLAVPYDARSVVEDLEYHIRIVRAGRRVQFADAATVWGDMPVKAKGSTSQRARWEGGRFRMIAEMAPALFKDTLKGNTGLIEPLLELLLLPLAFHCLLLGALLVWPVAPLRIYAIGGLGLVAGHTVAAACIGKGGLKDLGAVLIVPLYILWKLALLGRLLRTARHNAEWIRTERSGPQR
jgi:cellulose synthase/poly-beta-1,6-N-acetylglucosamine synthase-like glycosyltransferase